MSYGNLGVEVDRAAANARIFFDYFIDPYTDPETGEYFPDTSWILTVTPGGGTGGFSSEYGSDFLDLALPTDPGLFRYAVELQAYNTFSAESLLLELTLFSLLFDMAGQVQDGTEGRDLFYGGAGDDRLQGLGGEDHLEGGEGDDQLEGGDGADQLHGNAGDDRLSGGAGDDLYTVDSAGDVVVELPGGGVDSIHASVDYTLPEEVEILLLLAGTAGWGNAGNNSLTGNDAANRLYGLGGDDALSGGGGRDRLEGGEGADSLDGGGGDDVLIGGAGDDNYYVDSLGDRTVEAADGGLDTVYLAAGITSYTLRSNVEVLASFGNHGFQGIGNASDNTLYGSGADDVLNGRAGDDWLQGGEGNDMLVGGAGADRLDGGAGIDTARYSDSDAAVRVDLALGLSQGGHAEGDSMAGIENLQGSNWGDQLRGDDRANRLFGRDGDDLLDGAGGNDTLVGGAGADTFVFGSGQDVVKDFDLAEDMLRLQLGPAFDSLAEVLAVAQAAGSGGQDTLLDFGAGTTLILRGVTLEALPALQLDVIA